MRMLGLSLWIVTAIAWPGVAFMPDSMRLAALAIAGVLMCAALVVTFSARTRNQGNSSIHD